MENIIYDNIIPINEEILYNLELCGDNSIVWQLGSADQELFSQSLPLSCSDNAENIQIESNKEDDQQAPQPFIQNPQTNASSNENQSKEQFPEKKKESFKCSQCGKEFTQRYSCKRHMREQHLNPESFRCNKCGLRFSKKFNLEIHQKHVHALDRRKTGFKCPHCCCIFLNKSAGQKHVKTYHAKPQCEDNCDFQDDNPQRDAENVIKQLMLLQKDLEDVDFHQKETTPHKLSAPAFGKLVTIDEATTIDESHVKEITITDRLYPPGEFKKLKVQQVQRKDGKYYLVCEFCSKEFEKPFSYLRHRRIHCGMRPYICVLCKKSFASQNELKRHCTIHKISKGNVISKSTYKCPKCLEIKSSISQFDRHLSSHLPASKITFKCPACQRIFQSFRSFIYHKHKVEDPELKMLKSLLPPPLCLIDGKEVSGVKSTAAAETFKCPLCGLIVSSYKFLKRHEKRHRNVWKYQCLICNGYYSSQTSLQEHSKIHLNVKNFKCTKCPKAFIKNFQLQRHILRHSNIKNFKCRYCEQVFKTPQYCRSHMLTHLKRLIHTPSEKLLSVQTIIENNEKTSMETRDMQIFQNQASSKDLPQNNSKGQNFKCIKCPLQFRYKAWLKKHMSQSHSDEKPFKCDKCSKTFRANPGLKAHLLTHENVEKATCLVCGKKYSSKKSLNVHLRLHTDEKPFNCEVCQKSFRTSGHLIQHRKFYHK